jgi:hypothetical protein
MSANIRDLYAQMKQDYDRCSQPCKKLDKDRKYQCFNVCDQQSKASAARFNLKHNG